MASTENTRSRRPHLLPLTLALRNDDDPRRKKMNSKTG
jgi:hypothetical protein